MTRFVIVFLALVLAPVMALANPSALWSRTNKNGEVHIRVTESNGVFTGTIEWMERPKVDKNNPDPSLRTRSLVGVSIFKDMKQDEVNVYKGTLYNPEDGKNYSGTLTVVNPKTLKLRGCVIWPLCKTDNWKRVAD